MNKYGRASFGILFRNRGENNLWMKNAFRCFSATNETGEEKKSEEPPKKSPFTKPYIKPAFLADDYDHLSGKKATPQG